MKLDETCFKESLDCFKEPIFILSTEGGCLYSNPAFVVFLETKPGEVSRPRFWPTFESSSLKEGELSTSFIGADGEPIAVKLQATLLASGLYVIRVLAGATRNSAVQNFHAQRLETLGMLAAGVAHDFNNVLAGILGHITYLKTILPGSGPHLESLVAIEDGARKASSMTQQILNFSKLDTASKVSRVEMCSLVLQTCKLLRGAISPEYNLEWKVPDKALFVLGVEGKLAQVVANLVINARDALKPDDSISVSLEPCADLKKLSQVFSGQDLSAKKYALLKVVDTGHGMSPEILSRVFEPYFSTKREKGTGLGLSTVDAIVRELGGTIEINSKISGGTQVSVYLPVVEGGESTTAISSSRAQPGLKGGHERILVVDDEYPVRNVLCVSLAHLGYEVDSACSGPEALAHYDQDGKRYDLVILDMLMPQLSGDQVFAKLRAIDGAARVLIISGYSSEEAVQKILKSGGRGFIQKPFTIEELSKKVRECLDP